MINIIVVFILFFLSPETFNIIIFFYLFFYIKQTTTYIIYNTTIAPLTLQ